MRGMSARRLGPIDETDVRALLRTGAPDAEIEAAVRSSVSYREMARRSLGITWMVLTES